MVTKALVSQPPSSDLEKRHDTERIFPTGPVPLTPGGAAQSFLRGTQVVQTAKPRMDAGPGTSFLGDQEPHLPGSAWFPPGSTTQESPPVATVFLISQCPRPLQGDFATSSHQKVEPPFQRG